MHFYTFDSTSCGGVNCGGGTSIAVVGVAGTTCMMNRFNIQKTIVY